MTSNWSAFRSVSPRWGSSDGWPCNAYGRLIGVPVMLTDQLDRERS